MDINIASPALSQRYPSSFTFSIWACEFVGELLHPSCQRTVSPFRADFEFSESDGWWIESQIEKQRFDFYFLAIPIKGKGVPIPFWVLHDYQPIFQFLNSAIILHANIQGIFWSACNSNLSVMRIADTVTATLFVGFSKARSDIIHPVTKLVPPFRLWSAASVAMWHCCSWTALGAIARG